MKTTEDCIIRSTCLLLFVFTIVHMHTQRHKFLDNSTWPMYVLLIYVGLIEFYHHLLVSKVCGLNLNCHAVIIVLGETRHW